MALAGKVGTYSLTVTSPGQVDAGEIDVSVLTMTLLPGATQCEFLYTEKVLSTAKKIGSFSKNLLHKLSGAPVKHKVQELK